MARVVASIEARMGSSRLPGKVLSDVVGKPALTRLVARLRLCDLVDDIVLATSTERGDDVLEKWALDEGVACYRGSENDVLLRVVEAHKKMQTEVIVEITGDCILTDPEIIDMGVRTFLEHDCDVVSNCFKSGFPLGLFVQVFRAEDLYDVARRIDDPAVREHVSLYFYEHPELYRLIHLFPPKRWSAPDLRLCLDYPEDLELNRRIYEMLEPSYGEAFGIEEIIQLFRTDPGLAAINSKCVEKSAR